MSVEIAFEILASGAAVLAVVLLMFAASVGIGLVLGRAGIGEPGERVAPPSETSDPRLLR